MSGGRKSVVFEGVAVGQANHFESPDATAAPEDDSEQPLPRNSSGPSRAVPTPREKRRSLISFAARAVEITGSPPLERSSSVAMLTSKRNAAPPPLKRGDSASSLQASHGPTERVHYRNSAESEEGREISRRIGADDPEMKEAMDSVQLRRRPRGSRKLRAFDDLTHKELSPVSVDDEWNDSDIEIEQPGNANLVGDYLLGGELGKGTFGTVYKALHTLTGEFVAIKEITTHGSADMTAVMGEVELLKRLHHPNIVEFKDMRQKNNKYYLALEYIENGSLKDVLNKFGCFPESLALIYVIQLLQGLSFLHDENIIHRDIKGANILITKNGTCKLADFGLAAELRDRSVEDPAGSVFWMAPELFDVDGDESSGTSKASDIWSLGCTVIELLTGRPPYADISSMAAIHAIVEDDHPPLPECSNSLRQFLMACLRKDPKARSTATQLLRHPWITRQTPQQSGDYNMLTRQLRDYRKSSLSAPPPQPGRLKSVRKRRQSVTNINKGDVLVRRLSKLTGAAQPGRLKERLLAAGVELNEEALHLLELQDESSAKLCVLASELHGHLVSTQDSVDELVLKRAIAEAESKSLTQNMENMRSKLKLLEENFNQSDEVLARLVYGSLGMSRFGDDVKKGVLKVKRPHDKWRKRHVLLKDNFVLFFKPDSSSSPADVLWLDRVSIEPQASKLVGEKFAFRLNTRKRTLLICAANDRIMVGWMKELSFPIPWYEADDFGDPLAAATSPRPIPHAYSAKQSSPLVSRRDTTTLPVDTAQLVVADDGDLNTKGFLSLSEASDVSAMESLRSNCHSPGPSNKPGLAAKFLSMGNRNVK